RRARTLSGSGRMRARVRQDQLGLAGCVSYEPPYCIALLIAVRSKQSSRFTTQPGHTRFHVRRLGRPRQRAVTRAHAGRIIGGMSAYGDRHTAPLPWRSRLPLVLGHRGAAQAAPENRRAALTAAMAAGLDGVETDLHRTRDGALVI